MNTDLHLYARVQSAQKGITMSEELAIAIADAAELARLRGELDAARERERIATDAYNQQQTSYRELEGLYHDAQQNYLHALEAITTERRRLEAVITQCARMKTIKGARAIAERYFAGDWTPPPPEAAQ